MFYVDIASPDLNVICRFRNESFLKTLSNIDNTYVDAGHLDIS